MQRLESLFYLNLRYPPPHTHTPPQVFDGAVIVLSLAPMVASTVANGPNSPWDAISLIITLRIWRIKRIIDGEAGKNSDDSFCDA